MNWGGFAGGLAQGFANGVYIGKTVNETVKQKQLDDIRAQGIAEAKDAHAQAVNNLISEKGISGSSSGDNQVATTAPVSTPTVEQRPLSDATPSSSPDTAPSTTPSTNSASSAIPSADSPTTSPQITKASPVGATDTPQAQNVITKANPLTGGLSGSAPDQTGGAFFVGNKSFATREDAVKAAEKQVGPVEKFITDTVLKKQQQFYVQNGDLDKAEQLGKYIESKRGQDAVKTYGKAMTAFMIGDTDTGVKAFGDYYNRFIDDGVNFTGYSVGKDGNLNITLRKDGEDKDQTVSLSKKELLTLGMAYDPVKLQSTLMDQQAAQDKSNAEIAKEDRQFKRDIYKTDLDFRNTMQKDAKDFGQQKELKSIDQNNAIEKLTIEKQLDAANASNKVKREIGAKIDALRSAGYSEDFINEAMPGIMGIGDFKKKTSPEEARRLAFSDRMKADPYGFGKKKPEEQKAILDQDMALIYGGVNPIRNPAASGIATPPARQQTAPSRGVPLYDPKTGKTYYR